MREIPKLDNIELALNNLANQINSQLENLPSDDLAQSTLKSIGRTPYQELMPLREAILDCIELPLHLQKSEIIAHFLHANFLLVAT